MLKKLLLLPVFTFFLAACSLTQSSKMVTGNVVTTNLNENSIEIKNYAFNPSDVQAQGGATITVTNSDTVPHSVTSDAAGQFDTGLIQPGQTATFVVPNKTDTFAFHCSAHPYMRGNLKVTEVVTPTPTE